MEQDESAEECLQRELQEELGVTVRVGEPLCSSEYVYDHGSFRIEAFWVEILYGKLIPTVHDRLEWASALDLQQFDLLPADIPIAAAVVEFLQKISFL